jgi:hypothetical protein
MMEWNRVLPILKSRKILIGSCAALLFLAAVILFAPKRAVSRPTAECIKCHLAERIQTAQIEEWRESRHAKKGVGCYECHQANKGDPDAHLHEGFRIATIVSPKDCARCHGREFREFDASHHAKAGEILGSLDNTIGEVVEGRNASVQGCQSCHGSIVEVVSNGRLAPSTWPNLGIGRLNPDGSKGSCSACHAKHRFSLEVARSPDSCGKCHMGPDHPQKEIYEESKHGIIYKANERKMKLDGPGWILGKEYTQAPNCITCHMGGHRNGFSTHDLGGRLSWNLRTAVSKRMDDTETKRGAMKKVCLNCHSREWADNFYVQLDQSVGLYNVYAQAAAEIMARLQKSGKLTKTAFDEDIEWIYFELWHHEGRRARHGAAMMGPDYVQWHGFYEISKNFYFEFLPEARHLGEGAFVDSLLRRPEHAWIRGVKPDNLKLQEAAFAEWKRMSEHDGDAEFP